VVVVVSSIPRAIPWLPVLCLDFPVRASIPAALGKCYCGSFPRSNYWACIHGLFLRYDFVCAFFVVA
jgi:hypothetical protein